MPNLLYLDTARLGRMSPSAQLSQIEFVRIAGEYGGSLYFERFLQNGSNELPGPAGDILNRWRGINGLSTDLKQLVNASPESRVLFANRSHELMRLAAYLMFGPCRNILVTDLTWPAYLESLNLHCGPPTNRIIQVSLRDSILQERIPHQVVIDRILDAYETNACDGLFLPAVDNLGIRFPARECVMQIKANHDLRFVVIDGAQAVGHIPVDLSDDWCDFFLAGCHKWLRAYQPLGLGYFGSDQSRHYIQDRVNRLIATHAIDDPLLALTENMRNGRWDGYTETVNLVPLFSCHGALQDLCLDSLRPESLPAEDRHTLTGLLESESQSRWRLVRPHPSMESRILLIQRRACGPVVPKEQLRQQFLQHGIALTTYDDNVVRLSLPHTGIDRNDRLRIATAFRNA